MDTTTRILKIFADMGANKEDLLKELYKLSYDPQYLYECVGDYILKEAKK